MNDYIRRKDLCEAMAELLESPYANDNTLFGYGVRDALKLVYDMANDNVSNALKIPSAVDVVEVVRCKDCKFYRADKDGVSLCNCPKLPIFDPEESFFCGFAVRREEIAG